MRIAATILAALWGTLIAAKGEEPRFKLHFVTRQLPVSSNLVGDYGCTALVDLDGDGDLDFVVGGRPTQPSQLYWYEFKSLDTWQQHLVGTNYLSDVGLAAMDVDGDRKIDLVCSGVWFRNPGDPTEQPFERYIFDPAAAGAHDILVADIDHDGRNDIVMMGDERTTLNALCWYSIPEDPREHWTAHRIGPPVHGAITPGGVADIDGDGDLDVVRADTWFENMDGKGLEWLAHKNIPMGRKGPFGVCVRTMIADIYGDHKMNIVMADADISDSKVVILKNLDGKGGSWSKTELPQSFTYGSLHALAVADVTGDDRLDVIVHEQEELLPAGRENPRLVIWQNLGAAGFLEHIVLDQKLGGHELQVGDVDHDGDIDIVTKPWGPRPWNGNGGRMHIDLLENLQRQK